MAYEDYVFANEATVPVYQAPTGGKVAANVFLGEWMKRLPCPEGQTSKRRIYVRYRGGKGWIEESKCQGERMLELYFLSVGQGDSILIQTPDDRRVLIDGGLGADAHQFIRNKYRLDKPDNFIDFDAVIATHSDDDHTGGLIRVLNDPKIAVRRFLHNGLFPGAFERSGARAVGLVDDPRKPSVRSRLSSTMKRLADAIDFASNNLAPAVAAMKAHGRQTKTAGRFGCRRLDRTQGLLDGFDTGEVKLEVLWPNATTEGGKLGYPWYGTSSYAETVNGNSVVLKLSHGAHSVLLTGDLNEPSMKDAAELHGARLQAHVYKAAHHGSQKSDLGFMQLVSPHATVISAGDDGNDKHGHPRAELLGTVGRASGCEKPAIFVTELACCFRKLNPTEMRRFKASSAQLYERSIQGIISLRSDGRRMVLGTVPDLACSHIEWCAVPRLSRREE